MGQNYLAVINRQQSFFLSGPASLLTDSDLKTNFYSETKAFQRIRG